MSPKHLTIPAVGLLALTCVLGCGQAENTGKDRFAISGTVAFQGAPINGGTIALIPLDELSHPAGGVIENGAFSVPDVKGPNKGQYRVAVYWHQPTGKKIADPDTGEQIDEMRQVIPPKYNAATELSYEVLGDAEKDKLELNLE